MTFFTYTNSYIIVSDVFIQDSFDYVPELRKTVFSSLNVGPECSIIFGLH